jgi:hypothetical protein
MCQTTLTPILKRPLSKRRVPKKMPRQIRFQASKSGKTFTHKLFEALNIKIFKDQIFQATPFAALLGLERKFQTCKSLVNICLCAAYVQGSFSSLSDSRIFSADIGSVKTQTDDYTIFNRALVWPESPLHCLRESWIQRICTQFRYYPNKSSAVCLKILLSAPFKILWLCMWREKIRSC